MEPILSNWVKLDVGVAKRLHFNNHVIMSRPITDPTTKMPIERQSLTFYVDREDGRVVSKSYSVLSEKHAGDFAGYLPDYKYRNYEFVIVKEVAGPMAPRILEVRPYVP
jgi:hypothetical protein